MKQTKLIFRLLAAIVLGVAVGNLSAVWNLGWTMQIMVFGESLLKDVIQFFLPLIMITFLSVGIAELGRRAGRMLKFTLGLSYVYTVVASALGAVVIIAFFEIFPSITHIVFRSVQPRTLPPNFVQLRIPFPFSESLITSMVLGFVLGIGLTWTRGETLMKILREGRDIADQMIRRVIIPIIPFYIGCVFSLIAFRGDIVPKLRVFGYMLLVIVILQWIWLLFQYGIAGAYTGKNPFLVIRTMFPAYLTAFGTTSSAVAMPVSLERGKSIPFMREDIANFVFPLCSQTHMSGSGLTMTIIALTVSLITAQSLPDTIVLALFILVLSVVEVGAVGVPGGSVMAAWPVLTGILGFGEEALGLMFALFLLQDSFGTATNIIGDASIAMIVNKKFGTP
ncbi:MAG: cation:dicarboxylase symporter family transporter [Candidatus Aminicenantes bacterium]|nr:cation:dicarboxylase symporter family transporter [Candidatus Aminicenantes bacterium]